MFVKVNRPATIKHLLASSKQALRTLNKPNKEMSNKGHWSSSFKNFSSYTKHTGTDGPRAAILDIDNCTNEETKSDNDHLSFIQRNPLLR